MHTKQPLTKLTKCRYKRFVILCWKKYISRNLCCNSKQHMSVGPFRRQNIPNPSEWTTDDVFWRLTAHQYQHKKAFFPYFWKERNLPFVDFNGRKVFVLPTKGSWKFPSNNSRTKYQPKNIQIVLHFRIVCTYQKKIHDNLNVLKSNFLPKFTVKCN